MAWTPNPNEPAGEFEGQIAENALTILTRDFKGALDYHYLDTPTYTARYGVANSVGPTGSDLADFAELELGPPLRNVFPSGSIEPIRSTIEESEDGSHLIEEARIRIYVGVTGDGPKATTRKLFKYVRVIHLVLQNARNDFRAGMSNPFGVVLMSFDHAYDAVRTDNTTIMRAAAVEVAVALRER